jgi:hypothetical protein
VLIDFVTVSLFVLITALVLSVWNARDGGLWIGETYRWLATGIIALPIGLFLIVAAEITYGVGAILYGAVAIGVAMYGSNRAVLLAAGSLIWPIFAFDPSKRRRRKE